MKHDEVLKRIKDIARTIYSTSDKGSSHEERANKIIELIMGLHDQPIRNCDVGTAKEYI